MKLHLPVLLRKALLACFSFTFACTCSAAAADLSLGSEDALTIDYADATSIRDLENGTLQLNGDTLLLLSNCGVGDGKTYILLTGVSALRDAEGNAIVLDSSNNAISHYFDTTRPGVGFWADATLALTDDGTLQLVRHQETVKAARTITTRQTQSLVYSYYAEISFEDITQASSSGGAIYGESNSTITLSDNACVVFSGNTASGSAFVGGGAIYGLGTITLNNNGSVEFSGNTASSGSIDLDFSLDVRGGAIYGGTITLSNNGSVTFSGNKIIEKSSAYGYACGVLHGGAIYGSDITLSNNGSVEFCGNQLVNDMGFVYQYYGGAISGSDITLNNNARVLFNENMSTYGGAISGSDITLSNNGSVEFCGNTAYRAGGAIDTDGSLHIRNNESVEFAGNVEEGRYANPYRLRSVYVGGGSGDVLSISAAAGKSVAFYDSIYVGENATVNLNADYEDAEGNIIEQKGDIVFTGATTVADLYKAKGNVAGTEEEIRLSRTSEVLSMANLYNGRLIIKEGAIWSGAGITVDPVAGVTGKPTLLLQNGTLTHDASSVMNRNVVTIKSGGAFEVSGKSQADYTSLVLEGGSSWIFNIGSDNTAADSAVLSMDNSSLMLSGGGKVTLQLNAATGLAHGKAYALLSGIVQPTGWNADTITITSGTSGWNAGFSDLTWVDSTLWLYYDARPDLETATWTNESGDGKWNTSSVNWEQNEIDYEYKNGVAVVFDGQGTGTVDLVGEQTPGSVLVNNATGQDYTFGGSGSLAGDMKLTKKGAGNLIISTANSYTGGTEIDNSLLTITHANALGTGGIVTKGNSRLVVNGVTLKLQGTIDNTAGGELSLKGALDASALAYTYQSDTRVSLDGLEVGKTKSGFGKDGQYQVVIVDGGTTKNEGVMVQHDNHRLRIPLMLGADGVAYASMAGVDYSRYHLTGDDRIAVSEIADVSYRESGMELVYVDMDSGSLEVDRSIAVNAIGGSISITDDAVLSGTVEDTAVSSLLGAYDSTISATMEGTSSLTVNGGNITVSGDNSYTGGTTVNGGKLVAGSNTAFGSGDVAVNDGGTLDLGACIIANRVLLSGDATLAHADGASNILLQSGANADFANGFELSAGKSLTVGAGMAAFARSRVARVGGTVYRGALTLGGGELTLNEHLTVEGHVNFGAGTTTIVNVAGWQGAEAGTELASFSSNSGYTEESLTLRGAAAGLVLNFDAATGVLSLVAAQQPLPPAPPAEPEFVPNLNRNQQEVYDTVKDIVAGGEKPEGELGKLVELISGSRNEAELRELLDAVGGSEYATLMSSQLDGNLAHVRNLRNRMGSGWELVGNNYMRAMIEMFGQHSEVDGDAHGRGYTRSEMGGQFTLEFIGCMHMSSGVALASGHTRLNPDDALRQSVNNNYVDFYTTYRGHGHCNMGYSAKFSLGIGTHDYNLRRNVPGTSTTADADGFSVNFMHESAYIVRLSQGSSLQVFGVVESSFSSIGGFREKGAGTASLVMESQDAWATDITLGLRYVQLLDSFALPQATLTLQAGVTAGVGDTSDSLHLHFAGAPDKRYYQTGADRNRRGYNLGVGLHVPVSNTSAFYMSGETILRGDSYEWNGNVGFQIAF